MQILQETQINVLPSVKGHTKNRILFSALLEIGNNKHVNLFYFKQLQKKLV